AADAEQRERGKEPGYTDRRPVVAVAGRVVLHRDNGKLIWMNLRDHTGDLQVAVSQRDCAEAGFKLAKITDLGDLVIARGPLVKTKPGEVTVWASSLGRAAKSLAPPPAKHEGLQDVEIRYRQRYVDLWANPETMRVFRRRSAIVSRLRRFLDERGFMEVESIAERRSEVHTSELQSCENLVCRLLLEKKKDSLNRTIYIVLKINLEEYNT